jgi:hypothetical protein
MKAMLSTNTLSLAPDVNDWLANSRHPRILHVFDQVCNLINERREVLSIVTSEIGNGPFNLVIEDDICFSEYLNLQTLISNSLRQLEIGNLTINTADAKLWIPRPDWEELHIRRYEIFDQLMSLSLPNHQLSIPDSITSTASSALANADISTVRKVASRLAGLGQGLTPSGDDYIMGAILAAWIIHPIEIAKVIADDLAKTAASLTTSLSAAFLISAGKGEAGSLWHDFFDRLISEETMEIHSALEGLLNIGHSSGFDALSGFIDTYISYIKRESILCPS